MAAYQSRIGTASGATASDVQGLASLGLASLRRQAGSGKHWARGHHGASILARPAELTAGAVYRRIRTGLPKAIRSRRLPAIMRRRPAGRRVGAGLAQHTARMPDGSADQPKSAAAVDVYWRRRVIALVAGLGMLALVTWTVTGRSAADAPGGPPTCPRRTGQHSAPARHPCATPGARSRAQRRPAAPAAHRAGHRSRGTGATPSNAGPAHAARPDPAQRATSAAACRGLLSREPRPEPVLRPVQLPRARPSRSSTSAWCPPLAADARPTWAPTTCPCGSGRAGRPGSGTPRTASGPPRPGSRRWPAESRRWSSSPGTGSDLGPRLPPSAPGRPAGHLHRHRVQREPWPSSPVP